MAIKGARHGPRPSYKLKPGEHLCFHCKIDKYCDDADKRCLWAKYHRTKKMITKWWGKTEVA